ncbi:restriction endonuclease PLD domain-containing protein [Avibacterium sp. 21-586]|uniref:restriction endonuclease PLD domain-containing protein n=1 Tax=Avibacterium sp. 21-586 TaxID=2911534 RepID=UPI002247322B|nr:restriction endonuclease PLD domain-containing protein [Avibacterium sp. 21-586]
MDTVFSNIAGAKITTKSLNQVWMNLFRHSDEVLMATGYVSNDAVQELHKILEQNQQIAKVKLLVGMHYLEGFSKPQYQSLCELNAFLQEHNRGTVYVTPFVKFHGKMYAFKSGSSLDGLIGSANLTCFWDKTERTYETMIHLDDHINAQKLHDDIHKTIQSLGKPINQVDAPTEFKAHNVHLEQCLGVEKIPPEETATLFSQKSKYIFNIPAKTEEKSNLNVFFGEGRKDKRGFVKSSPMV